MKPLIVDILFENIKIDRDEIKMIILDRNRKKSV